MKHKYSVLIPHYKTGKMTAYSISQFIKYKGDHELEIIIINNSAEHDSIDYIMKTDLIKYCKVIDYPKGIMQSHGIGLDYLLINGHVSNELFITAESDSFPTQDGWLNYYDNLVDQGIDSAGSILQLSGGVFLHPCSSFYKKSVWQAAYDYCRTMDSMYQYFPNMIMHEDFPCHAMIKRGKLLELLPELHPKLNHSYQSLTHSEIIQKATDYHPTVNPFHNGMGNNQEQLSTYRFRSIFDYYRDAIIDGKEDVIKRMGYEPGQWFSYWMNAMDYKIANIPTEVKWLPNRENQQQEYTKNAVGFTHAWAVTSYNDCEVPDLQDIVVFKRNQMEEWYNSLPENFKL